jgi:hypothetical protein
LSFGESPGSPLAPEEMMAFSKILSIEEEDLESLSKTVF